MNTLANPDSTSLSLRLAPIFQDHAVLQRNLPIPVWGEAPPDTLITVRLGSEASATTTVDATGHWLIRLPAQPAGGPHELTIETPHHSPLIVQDVLIGEVWICSGQSNMEYPLGALDINGEQSKNVYLPNVRLLTVQTPAQPGPQTAIDGQWEAVTPDTLAKFSAVAGWFGRTIHETLDIPIGLIVNAWGGSRIQAWLSREALMTDPAGPSEIDAYEPLLYGTRKNTTVTYTSIEDWLRDQGTYDPENLGLRDGWDQLAFDDHTWPTMDLPTRWQDVGHDHTGVFWFRRRVTLPTTWQGRSLRLNLGAIDKHDDTYVNGQRVGGMSWENPSAWNTPRFYEIPATLLADTTEIVIAVRARSHIYQGGMTGPSSAMSIHPIDALAEALPLHGKWAFAIEYNWGNDTPNLDFDNRGPGGMNAPYTLFNTRLHPLIPYGIRGFLWYQGESNEGEPLIYRRLLPLLIADWRRVWGQGEIPFLQVQLANYNPAQEKPVESNWAGVRAAQAAALRVPGVGMAVAIDVGEAADIHPKDKKSVGQRLARWALAQVYGRGGVPSGPLLRALVPAPAGRLRLAFDYATGLTTRDNGPVRHIAIAGSDHKFQWAESCIDGEHLEVWHPEIPSPTTVRYAWADNPEGCNLVNAADLPASPFDTDDLLQ